MIIFIKVSYIEINNKLPSLNYSNYGVNPLRFGVFLAYFVVVVIVVVVVENACFRVGISVTQLQVPPTNLQILLSIPSIFAAFDLKLFMSRFF
jgi:hypothetical protein